MVKSVAGVIDEPTNAKFVRFCTKFTTIPLTFYFLILVRFRQVMMNDDEKKYVAACIVLMSLDSPVSLCTPHIHIADHPSSSVLPTASLW